MEFCKLWFVSRALRVWIPEEKWATWKCFSDPSDCPTNEGSKFQISHGALYKGHCGICVAYVWPVCVCVCTTNCVCVCVSVFGLSPVNICIDSGMCVNNKWLWAHHLCKLPQSSPQEADLQAEALYLLLVRASPGPIVRLHNSAAKNSERVDSCVTATANTPQ